VTSAPLLVAFAAVVISRLLAVAAALN